MKPCLTAAGRFLLVGLAITGCKVSASASGNVRSSDDASAATNASASASATAQANPPPEPAPAAITFRGGRLDYEGVINFEYDKAELRQDAITQGTLSEMKKFLAAHANVAIEIEGHTDSRGSDEYNLELSDRRAASVRRWLVDNGLAEARVTSIGKGESQPQVPEPEPCNDKEPADSTQCEKPWAANRRVVFQVTQGAETLPSTPAPAPPPAPPPVAQVAPTPAPPLARSCPWLWGGHVNALGPNSWAMLAGATQPGVCWLELSLGVGLGFNQADVDTPDGGQADGSYVSLTFPLRGRFWFMQTHSFIADLGLGFTHYRISADLEDGADNTGDYRRRTTPMIAHLGLGYGFRPNGAEAGPRLALVLGGLVHLTRLGRSQLNVPEDFVNAAALRTALDNETNDLKDPEPYAELSFGWLF